jgi:hypothetical protein
MMSKSLIFRTRRPIRTSFRPSQNLSRCSSLNSSGEPRAVRTASSVKYTSANRTRREYQDGSLFVDLDNPRTLKYNILEVLQVTRRIIADSPSQFIATKFLVGIDLMTVSLGSQAARDVANKLGMKSISSETLQWAFVRGVFGSFRNVLGTRLIHVSRIQTLTGSKDALLLQPASGNYQLRKAVAPLLHCVHAQCCSVSS